MIWSKNLRNKLMIFSWYHHLQSLSGERSVLKRNNKLKKRREQKVLKKSNKGSRGLRKETFSPMKRLCANSEKRVQVKRKMKKFKNKCRTCGWNFRNDLPYSWRSQTRSSKREKWSSNSIRSPHSKWHRSWTETMRMLFSHIQTIHLHRVLEEALHLNHIYVAQLGKETQDLPSQ